MKKARTKRKAVGRPYLGRTETFVVSTTPDEYADLMVAAAKAGLRVPIYVRTMLGLEE